MSEPRNTYGIKNIGKIEDAGNVVPRGRIDRYCETQGNSPDVKFYVGD